MTDFLKIAVFRRIHLGMDAVTQMDYSVNVDGKTPRAAALDWMQRNRAIVDAWFWRLYIHRMPCQKPHPACLMA